MQFEVANLNAAAAGIGGMNSSTEGTDQTSTSAVVKSNHPDLPRIRFLPDGSVSETSPQMVRLIGNDQNSFWLVLSRSRLNYELRSQPN